MNKQLIKTQKAPTSRSMGPHVRQVIPSAIEHVDPFVFLDHFGPLEKNPDWEGVPPHPHAGISTITYLFSGSNRHQDSYGNDAVINAGDIGWMQAGKGIVHAEGMHENRTTLEVVHGLQFWISLPAKDKFIEPDFFYHPSADLPTFQIHHASIKVLCGELLGHRSPIKSLSPAYIYEVKIPANASIEIPIKNVDTAGLYMIGGSLHVEENTLLPNNMTAFSLEGDQLALSANEDSHFILFGGTPLNEPMVGYASFVMNTEAQINQVMLDFQTGKMGTIKN
jgi:redox-sensitive bicupin YhaK (pirin superfamily)